MFDDGGVVLIICILVGEDVDSRIAEGLLQKSPVKLSLNCC